MARRRKPEKRGRPRPMTLRIVAGELGGRRLVTPDDVRPTTERVREALFSSLGEAVVDVSVLDLFAGSGAMGLEAVSRGATAAVLVDVDRSAAAACRANVEALGVGGQARVVERSVRDVVSGPPPAEAPFGLVCCDPPYDVPGLEVADVTTSPSQAGSPQAPGSSWSAPRATPGWSRGPPAGSSGGSASTAIRS
jgi:16S rRNA (guanine966-N2)-methyltransferase